MYLSITPSFIVFSSKKLHCNFIISHEERERSHAGGIHPSLTIYLGSFKCLWVPKYFLYRLPQNSSGEFSLHRSVKETCGIRVRYLRRPSTPRVELPFLYSTILSGRHKDVVNIIHHSLFYLLPHTLSSPACVPTPSLLQLFIYGTRR